MDPNRKSPRIVWVHNFATHYTVRLFELVSRLLTAEFLFFSDGEERYWLKANGVQQGNFPHVHLHGIQVLGTRIALCLPWRLWKSDCDAIVQCIDGKFALPVTYLVARLRRKPFVLYTGVWMRVDTLLHRLAFPFVRHIYRNADALIVYGEHVMRYLIQEGVRPERIFVETHAVDNRIYGRVVTEAELADLRLILAIPCHEPVILYVGRMEPEKGLEQLIRAFASMADSQAVLVLAGTGSQQPRLRSLAARLGVAGRVRWPGYVPPSGTPPYYALASVFVLPSITTRRDKETWGLVVNEAFNQSLPVIATDAVGAAAGGLIEDGVNGLIVPEGDAAALMGALRQMLCDEPRRRAMGALAHLKISTWDQEGAAATIEKAVRFAIGDGCESSSAPPDPAGVYVVIPVHNRVAFTRVCLDALSSQTVRGFHVVVIDDGSSDGTTEMIRAEFPAVRLLAGDGTLWWSGATNLGIAESKRHCATHILTLNDDTKPPPDFIENMLTAAGDRPGAIIGAHAVDAVSGRTVYGGEWMRWLTASSKNLMVDKRRARVRLVETTHYPGRGLLIPVGVFDRIGQFDAVHFPQTAADYDFTHRARRAGYRVFCDSASVLRIHPAESGDAAYRLRKGWRNYYRHLFDVRGGGNLQVFFWYAVRNCPTPLLPICLVVGLTRRAGGYLLDWMTESP
jgi:GT2 family glycosyltransferase/glycosyltransferase involved in cell wall biosynthesis